MAFQSSPTPKPSAEGRIESQIPHSEDSYQYEPLPPRHIRVLKLLPGFDTTIEISLESVSLDNSKEFETIEALSYTWGKPTPAHTVVCNGQAVSVTPNLYDALVALRKPDNSGLLWIDQICINQRDNVEKSQQVQIMHLIYSKASRVLVWLSEAIFLWKDILGYMGTLYEFSMSLNRTPQHDASAAVSVEDIPLEAWVAFIMVFESPYFTRVWMIQEVVMARECIVVAGGGSLKWHVIEQMLLLLKHQEDSMFWIPVPLPVELRRNTRCFQKMMTLRSRLSTDNPLAKLVWSHRPRWTLLDMVRKSWGFDATDKRDKIYALVGLLQITEHCAPQDIYPDYSSATTYADLVRKAFVHGLTKDSNLESLLSCRPRSEHRFPSWSFDSEDIHASATPYELGFESGKYRTASETVPVVRRVSGNDSELVFKVTKIGKISELGSPFPGAKKFQVIVEDLQTRFTTGINFKLKDMQRMLRNNIELIYGVSADPFVGLLTKSRVDFCRAFFCDISLDGNRFAAEVNNSSPLVQHLRSQTSVRTASFMLKRTAAEEAFIRLFIQEYDDHADLIFRALLGRFPSLCNGLRRISNMRFARGIRYEPEVGIAPGVATQASSQQSPLMCWVPLEAEADDVIAAIHGFRMPMLMRRVPGLEERYIFLGICFVYGFMDGEALATEGLHSENIIVV